MSAPAPRRTALQGTDVVVCEPVRTPVGRYGGVLKDVTAAELGATVVRALLERTGLDPAEVDDVVLGQGYPNGEAPGIGRVAALDAGLPVTVPGMQVDRRCGSGLQAVLIAAGQVSTGAADVVLAGGAESMSQVEHYSTSIRWGAGGASRTRTRNLGMFIVPSRDSGFARASLSRPGMTD